MCGIYVLVVALDSKLGRYLIGKGYKAIGVKYDVKRS